MGCGKDPVNFVKDGTLLFDESVTIGDVYNSYKFFKNKEWKSFKGEQNRLVVEFRGEVILDLYKNTKDSANELSEDIYNNALNLIHKFTYITQFVIYKNNRGFKIAYSGFEILGKNGKKVEHKDDDLISLKNIFKNELDKFTFDIIYKIGYEIQQEKAKREIIEKAIRYTKACNEGSANGCFKMGVMSQDGNGVDRDYVKALEYYQKACNGGSADGCFKMGVVYQNGNGVDRDCFKALEYYQKACNGDNVDGCYLLGNMFDYYSIVSCIGYSKNRNEYGL